MKASDDYKALLAVCDGLLKLTYTELKILSEEINTQLACWTGDTTMMKDVITDAARQIKEEYHESK